MKLTFVPVESYISKLETSYTVQLDGAPNETNEADQLLLTLSSSLHAHFPSTSVQESERNSTKDLCSICNSIETKTYNEDVTSQILSRNTNATKSDFVSVLSEAEMAKLKSSFYKLGRPTLASESDRKLWKVKSLLYLRADTLSISNR